ncbi:MAG: ThiF family adenylyltransferase [Candidatus Acidiferrales bacterium]
MNSEQREKYSRQILFPGIGEAGQERLLGARAALVGCGALGTVVANLLVRAGLGQLRIIDRDFVETSNLQRQTLFEEADAREALPKATAAERRLRAINSDVRVEGVVADLTPENSTELLEGFEVILDGTDNFETRLLLNDLAIARNIPWIYAAAVGSYGVTMTIRPGETSCLACLTESEEKSAALGAEATCDTAGVVNAAVGVIASIEAAEATKLLAGRPEALNQRLISCDVWNGRFQSIRIARNADCRACGRREFTYLAGEAQPHITMCGRDSVQIHERGRRLDLDELGRRIAQGPADGLHHNEFLLRFRVAPYELTVFTDGRAIVKGTKDPAVARTLYARYIGA